MHKDFAQWLSKVNIGDNTERLEARWAAIEKFLKDLKESDALSDLVRLLHGAPPKNNEFKNNFRQYFKDVDEGFYMSENDIEVKVLAASTLATLCTTDKYEWSTVAATAILTANCINLRKLDLHFDLTGMAKARMIKESIGDRERPALSNNFKKLTITAKKTLKESVGTLKEEDDVSVCGEAIVALSTLFADLEKANTEMVAEFGKLQKFLNLQDEELDTLSWLIGGYSTTCSVVFSEIKDEIRPMILAKEVSAMNTLFSEPPSLSAMLSRVGIQDGTNIPIKKPILSCTRDQLRELAPSASVCPLLFPLHNALFRADEVNGVESWTDSWSQVSGIESEQTASPVQIAIQFYREIKLLEESNR